MIREEFITLSQLCTFYKVEMSFFGNLNDIGLIEITTIEKEKCIASERIADIEKIVRMHRELELNIESIDVVFNLLDRIDALRHELLDTRNRLRLYEGED